MASPLSIDAGILRLEAPSKAGQFLSLLVKLNDHYNIPIKELIIDKHRIINRFLLFPYDGLEQLMPWTVNLDGRATVIRGYYEDRYQGFFPFLNYELNIYLYYEEEESTSCCCEGICTCGKKKIKS